MKSKIIAIIGAALALSSTAFAQRTTGFKVPVFRPTPTPTAQPVYIATPSPIYVAATPTPTPAPIVASLTAAEIRAKAEAYVAENRQWAHLYNRSSVVWPEGSAKRAEYEAIADSFEDRARGAEELFLKLTGEKL